MDNREGRHLVKFRTQGDAECELLTQGILSVDEWSSNDSYNRIFKSDWNERYDYEASVINQVINNFKINKILELGPGPGLLNYKIKKSFPDLEYHLIDIEAAKIANEKEELGGIFHVQDLNHDLDITNLPKNIDLFIANDFLEHIQNPANIVLKAKSVLKQDGFAFISVPNWRMGHAWIYRGLFDWDNFIHFMWQHGFKLETYIDSPLKCSHSPRLDSELTMPEEMITSWNFYLLFKRNDI